MTAVLGGLGTFAAWIVVMALNPRTLVRRHRLDGARDRRLRPLPPQPEAAADRDRQGRDAGAARGRGGRVPQRPGRLRGRRSVLAGDGRDRGQARLQAPPRDPRPLDADRADQPAAERRDARAGSRGAAQDRGGEADRRPAGDRPRRPGPARARPATRSPRRRRRSRRRRSSSACATATACRSTTRPCRRCSASAPAG